jgi:ATP-dependent Lhr-like helicase
VLLGGGAPRRAAAPARVSGSVPRPRPGRGGRYGFGRPSMPTRTGPPTVSGRWSLLPPRDRWGDVDPTLRAHALALTLLERHGVLTRGAVAAERIAGGFAAVYPVLRAMEEAGKLRRGHFVEGFEGAQFAFAGAVDQLRAARDGEVAPAVVLAAADPANPYGAVLPWPAPSAPEAGRPRRTAGAAVVLVDGAPVLYLERSGRGVLTFPSAGGPEALTRAAEALRGLFADRRRRALRVERIDGAPALGAPGRSAFERAGFRAEYKGLALDRFSARSPAPASAAGKA